MDDSIRMIQLYRKAIVEPLRNLILSFLEDGVYPHDWKKSNVVRIHSKKKTMDQLVSFQPSAKYLKELFLTPCSISSLKISYLVNVNQVFYKAIFASHSSFPLHPRYINLLIVTVQSMQEGHF